MDNTIGSEKILKLILRFSIPSMIAIFVNTLYNIIDRIFIGQFVGADALAGLTMVYPVMLVIFAGSALIGRGGANLISIELGKKDQEAGHKIFTTTVFITVAFGLVMSIVGILSLETLLKFLGASGYVLSNAYDYMSIIFTGVIFWILSYTLSSTVRAEGEVYLSMIAMIVSAVINIVLDYIFIVLLGWGVSGAAYATIIAQFFAFAILATYYLRSRLITFKFKYLKVDYNLIKRLLYVGLPSYFVTVGSGVSLMVLNRYLGLYGGVASVASIGAIGSLMSFFNIPVLGIQNGIQAIIGFNHGAGHSERVRKTLAQSLIISLLTGSMTFFLIRYQAETLISWFIQGDNDYLLSGVEGLKMYSLLIPLTGIINISIAYLQSIEEAFSATIISLSKQILILIPLVMYLSSLWGLNGVWLAIPIADSVSILIAIIFIMRHTYKRPLKRQFV